MLVLEGSGSARWLARSVRQPREGTLENMELWRWLGVMLMVVAVADAVVLLVQIFTHM